MSQPSSCTTFKRCPSSFAELEASTLQLRYASFAPSRTTSPHSHHELRQAYRLNLWPACALLSQASVVLCCYPVEHRVQQALVRASRSAFSSLLHHSQPISSFSLSAAIPSCIFGVEPVSSYYTVGLLLRQTLWCVPSLPGRPADLVVRSVAPSRLSRVFRHRDSDSPQLFFRAVSLAW